MVRAWRDVVVDVAKQREAALDTVIAHMQDHATW
jgi:hypothetical protein